jgi:hypothetical protein
VAQVQQYRSTLRAKRRDILEEEEGEEEEEDSASISRITQAAGGLSAHRLEFNHGANNLKPGQKLQDGIVGLG